MLNKDQARAGRRVRVVELDGDWNGRFDPDPCEPGVSAVLVRQRRRGDVGILQNPVYGSCGELWLVRHPGGGLGAYWLDELELYSQASAGTLRDWNRDTASKPPTSGPSDDVGGFSRRNIEL